MLILAFFLALTAQQQAQHDATELAMFNRLQAQTNAVFEQDHPSRKTVSDYNKVRKCYTKFHLYKTKSCEAQLSQVDRDLAEAAK